MNESTPRTILLDLDCITADFYFGLLDAYRADTDEELHHSYIDEWDKVFPNGKNLQYYFGQPDFFRNLKPVPGAKEILTALHEAGNELVVVSAATLTSVPGQKFEWLSEHFPFIERKRVFFGVEKWRVRGDVLIDDHYTNVSAWKGANPSGYAIGIAYPYNVSNAGDFDFLAESYTDFSRAWRQIGLRLGLPPT